MERFKRKPYVIGMVLGALALAFGFAAALAIASLGAATWALSLRLTRT